MVQWVEALVPQPDTWDPHGRAWRMDSYEPSSDLHMCTVACACMNTHKLINIIKINRIGSFSLQIGQICILWGITENTARSGKEKHPGYFALSLDQRGKQEEGCSSGVEQRELIWKQWLFLYPISAPYSVPCCTADTGSRFQGCSLTVACPLPLHTSPQHFAIFR